MERKIDRFDKYMKMKGLNDNKVTLKLSLSVGTLGKSRKEGRDLSDKVIEQILNNFPDLSKVWLMTGEGDPIMSQSGETRQILEDPQTKFYEPLDPVAQLIRNNTILAESNARMTETHKILIESNAAMVDSMKKMMDQIIELNKTAKNSHAREDVKCADVG